METTRFFLHLVSDSTGATLHGVARAGVAQYENVAPIEKFWNFVRTPAQLESVIDGISETPGPVLFTLVDPVLRRRLREACRGMKLPCVPVLDPVLRALSHHLKMASRDKPGVQHELNEAYFDRIDAVDFALQHDDGQSLETIEDADVILVGVSRTSKTPTCMYLANRGVRAANIPLVPGVSVPDEAFSHKHPLYVGLIESASRLSEIRKNRLRTGADAMDGRHNLEKYHSIEAVEDELTAARRLFSSRGWPVIDVTRRSVEETAAEILMLFNRFHPDRMLF